MFCKKIIVVLLELPTLGFIFFGGKLAAQIIPDATLPINSTVTSAEDTNVIEGGTQAGSNLFHSFSEFSVPSGSTAEFNNTPDVQNIITRVTGGKISNIDGLIKTNGIANLFLLNPNGIIFSQDAKLDIGGSFLASTANSINFADGTKLSTTGLQNPPLLTINVPIGLSFNNPNAIVVQGNGHALARPFNRRTLAVPTTGINNSEGLNGQPHRTIALVGGDLILEGGSLTSQNGRIELGSVENGEVTLDFVSPSNYTLNYQNISNFKDIILSKLALIGIYGSEGGNLKIQASNIDIADGSVIINQNEAFSLGGELDVRASNSIKISGTSLDGTIRSGISSETIGKGKGADVRVIADNLNVNNGAGISTATYSNGDGGNLTVNTRKSIYTSEISPFNPDVVSGIVATTVGSGKGGDIAIATKKLRVEGGSGISTAAYAVGEGGGLTVNASENVQVVGYSLLNPEYVANIRTLSFRFATGGNLNLSTPELIIKDGGSVGANTFGVEKGGEVEVNTHMISVSGIAPISFLPSVLDSSTFGSGNAGNLKINTYKLLVQDGGRVDTSTLASGQAGNLTINASNSVEVKGENVSSSANPTIIESSAATVNDNLRRLFALPSEPSGSSGNVIINTPKLNVINEGQISVKNSGTGDAGGLMVNASSIFLARLGAITATSKSGRGGNISLQSQEIQLRSGSSITTDATGGIGNGGNINIDADILVGLENSDITATAVRGQGGNIQINTQGIFGIEPRSDRTVESDITASSELGVDGVVQINRPDVDPSAELVVLPSELIDASGLIAQSCPANVGRQASKFVVTGRGGLPEDPSKPLNGETVWTDLRPFALENQPRKSTSLAPQPEVKTREQADWANSSEAVLLVEANEWAFNSKGEVMLTASAPTVTPDIPWLSSTSCNGS
jgi:filamentous hemagglutinin family protein